MRRLQAIYEGGVLRPTESLHFAEGQLVSIILFDGTDDDSGFEFDIAPASEFRKLADPNVDREELTRKLAAIPGSMDEDIRAERDERF
jgi:predicted DNA-binding antitoxin AbrB/MazE fold protein